MTSKMMKRSACSSDDQSERKKPIVTTRNPMLNEFVALQKSWPSDMARIFDRALETERRSELWELMCEGCDALRKRYAWAIPDERALGVLQHLSPMCEIGAGRGYWCSCVEQRGGVARAYDRAPPAETFAHVKLGGPEVAAQLNTETLFLCYPDDSSAADATHDDDQDYDNDLSVALASLQHFRGDTIVLVGESFVSGGTFSLSQAPWGRSFDSAFQVELAASFHCLLLSDLPRWPISSDAISVWRRTRVCPIVYEGNEDEDDEEQDNWADIPRDERLSFAIAAPCLQHLFAAK